MPTSERAARSIKPAMVAGILLLGAFALPAQAQRPLTEADTTAVYAAVLRVVPNKYPGQKVLVDPRVMASSFRDAAPLDVWERDLPLARASAAVQRLHRVVDGLSYCTDVQSRTNCLTSNEYVHVMFGRPVTEGSIVTVEVTVTTRIPGSIDKFGIASWRYSVHPGPEGASITGIEPLAAGHGRIGSE
jgi:hypothetical protein